MIYREIQTDFSKRVHFSVWGKEETKELDNIPKEELTPAIRNLVSSKIGIPIDQVFILEQIHGDIFHNTKDLNPNQKTEGDALFTTNPEQVLVVKTADCMPIFFWSMTEQLIGIIHSGWKGTYLGISEKLFTFLLNKGYSLESIQSYIGPCAQKRNYEVGKELFEKFHSYAPEAIEPKGNDKYLLGINLVLKVRIKELDLPLQITDSEICTMENANFHSHRCGDTGRNLNLIYMK